MRASQLIVGLGVAALLFGCAEGSEHTYMAAAFKGDKALAEQLFQEGQRIDRTGESEGGQELAFALNGGHYDVAEILLDAGANVNGRAGGQPLLEYFQGEKKDEQVAWLKENGAAIRP